MCILAMIPSFIAEYVLEISHMRDSCMCIIHDCRPLYMYVYNACTVYTDMKVHVIYTCWANSRAPDVLVNCD